MAILNSDIYISHRQGIEKVSLSTYLRARIISSGPDYCSLVLSIAVYKDGLVYSDPQSHRILHWIRKEERVKVFACTGAEGTRDGLASRAEFYQPAGLCVDLTRSCFYVMPEPTVSRYSPLYMKPLHF